MGGLLWFGGVLGLVFEGTSSELSTGVCRGVCKGLGTWMERLTEWLLDDVVLECAGGVGGRSPLILRR